MGYDVFLSHRGPDKPFIEQLAAFLEPDISCWYAPRDILESETYSSGVLTGVESSSVFLVFLTEEFEKDPDNFVTNEVFHARKSKKKIIPVIKGRKDYPRVLEMHLNAIQWFDFDSYETVEEAYQQLRSIIQLLITNDQDGLDPTEFLSHIHNRVLHIPEGFSQVSESLLKKNKHVFVPTFDFSKIAADTPIHVFHGKPSSGKNIHSINYLLDRGKQIIFEGLSTEAVKSLLQQPLHEGSGYFIHIDRSDLNSILTESMIANLTERLQKANAELVLCTDQPIKYVQSTEIKLPEDKRQFILHHLSWTEADQEKLEEATAILEDVDGLHEIESSETLLDIVEQVARTLAQEQTLEQFSETIRYLRENQFELPYVLHRDASIDDILYNLAISLSHGKSFTAITETHDFLLQEYRKHFPSEQIQFHRRSLSTLKSDFHLKSVYEKVSNHLGSFNEEHIYYEYEVIATKIWPIVWKEYPYLHEFIASVLIELIGSKNVFLLSRIEDIIFSITDSLFEQGIENFIAPMAKSNNIAESFMTKRLLVRLYDQSKYKLKILRLLKNWMYTRNRRLEHSAMLTLQSKIGIENFTNSLGWVLDFLGRNGKYSQTSYLTFTYLSKFVYLDEEVEKHYYGVLYEKLKEWLDKEPYVNYLKLIIKTFKNNTAMFFESKVAFIDTFFSYLIIFLAKKGSYNSSASAIKQLLVDKEDYTQGKDKLKLVFIKLKEKMDPSRFDILIETIKKGD